MASSIELAIECNSQEEIYTHKKFKSSSSPSMVRSYTHKKFGTRCGPAQCSAAIGHTQLTTPLTNSTEEPASKLTAVPKRKTELFRPYALGDDTPRKRKIRDVHVSDQVTFVPQPQQQQQCHPQPVNAQRILPPTPLATIYPAQQQQQQQMPPPPSYHAYPPQQQHPSYAAPAPYLNLDKHALSLMLQKQRAVMFMAYSNNMGWAQRFAPNSAMLNMPRC